jgi:YD repeat-containing protein
VTYTYDPVGNRLSRAYATPDSDTRSTIYAYSPANRLTSAVGSDGVTCTYLYDQSGNRTQVQCSDSGITYLGWDARNQLASVELPAGVITFTYNADG